MCADLFLGEYVVDAACAKFAKYRDMKDKVSVCVSVMSCDLCECVCMTCVNWVVG